MPRKEFISTFIGNETNSKWLDKQVRSRKSYAKGVKSFVPDIRKAQARLLALQDKCGMTISEIKEINRSMSIGDAKARRAKKGDGRSQPTFGYLHR